MANHAYVKTKKKMTPELITDLLNRLNQERFKGILTIEYENCVGDSSACGPHVWIIKTCQHPDGGNYGERVCWLNTSRSFEIRHGGGGDFIWWIDCSICNEISLLFNGTISDDGGDGKWTGEVGRYVTFKDFLKNMHRHFSEQEIKDVIEESKVLIPKQFLDSLLEEEMTRLTNLARKGDVKSKSEAIRMMVEDQDELGRWK